ncbi:hypothetical protein J6590_098828 [Homalodisca vitripennis]|nr:hypothetical protein J6590_098828 [Homalodisca vitripennis]
MLACKCYSQQKHAVLTCFNILALVLSNHMAASDSPLLLSKAAKDVAWLSSVLSVLGAYVKEGNNLESVKEAVLVHKSLVKLSGDTIQLVSVHSPHYKIDPNRIKGHTLENATMGVAVPLLMLQLYVNPCMHYIVSPAIITVVMQHLGDSGHITRGELFKRYQFLRSLLAHEFVLYKEWEVKEFEDALLKLELVNIIESSTEEQLTLGNHRKLQLMMCNLLYPFLSGYLSLGQFLLQTKPEPISEKTLLQAGQAKIEADLHNGHTYSPYSLSLDMISCALSALTHLNVLSRSRTGGLKYFTDDLINVLLPVNRCRYLSLRIFSAYQPTQKGTITDFMNDLGYFILKFNPLHAISELFRMHKSPYSAHSELYRELHFTTLDSLIVVEFAARWQRKSLLLPSALANVPTERLRKFKGVLNTCSEKQMLQFEPHWRVAVVGGRDLASVCGEPLREVKAGRPLEAYSSVFTLARYKRKQAASRDRSHNHESSKAASTAGANSCAATGVLTLALHIPSGWDLSLVHASTPRVQREANRLLCV